MGLVCLRKARTRAGAGAQELQQRAMRQTGEERGTTNSVAVVAPVFLAPALLGISAALGRRLRQWQCRQPTHLSGWRDSPEEFVSPGLRLVLYLGCRFRFCCQGVSVAENSAHLNRAFA